MSYEIDNRIVEMQFRNKEFEKNIKKSTESLEKLKSGLDLKGAEKSLTSCIMPVRLLIYPLSRTVLIILPENLVHSELSECEPFRI